MKKRRSVLALLLVAALTVVLGGCQDGKDGKADSSDTTSSQVSTESTPTGEPVMGGSITVGIPQDIEDSLDPHKSVAAGTKEILFNIYEGLVKPDEEGNLNDAPLGQAVADPGAHLRHRYFLHLLRNLFQPDRISGRSRCVRY